MIDSTKDEGLLETAKLVSAVRGYQLEGTRRKDEIMDFTVSPSEQSTITAKVRDPAGNLVKNAIVVFQLDDITGGSLSAAQAPTNSQGEASVIYTASTTTSASNGVTITAFVQGAAAVSDSVNVTVASRELFISIGTGNEIFEPDSARYRVESMFPIEHYVLAGIDDVETADPKGHSGGKIERFNLDTAADGNPTSNRCDCK